MRLYLLIGLLVLVQRPSTLKVTASVPAPVSELDPNGGGSGDGDDEPPYRDQEGSGVHLNPSKGSHWDTNSDPYYDEEDEYEDYYDDYEPSGWGDTYGIPKFTHTVYHDFRDEKEIHIDDKDVRVGSAPVNEVFEEIYIEKDLTNEESPERMPSTTPPPTLTDDKSIGDIRIVTQPDNDRQVSIFAQPSILAAFIGGAVVGLLLAILLVMFIVYRMRKKDEGSYPLDEPKRMPLTASYSPNDKEIYA